MTEKRTRSIKTEVINGNRYDILHDRNYDEFRIVVKVNGKPCPERTYYTDDRADALLTLESMIMEERKVTIVVAVTLEKEIRRFDSFEAARVFIAELPDVHPELTEKWNTLLLKNTEYDFVYLRAFDVNKNRYYYRKFS